MAQDGKIEEQKRYNAPFLRAFKYLAEEKLMNQKQFAEVIDAESSYISALKQGTKRVGADYMARLAAAFVEHFEGKGHLNMDYLLGKSEYMLVENVPKDEVLENISRGANPDYDVMKKNAASATPVTPAANIPDLSSTLNASISAYVQLTNRLSDDLKRKEQEMADRLADKETIIAEKSARIATLESLLKEKDSRILDLQRQLAAARDSDLTGYPFPIGAAEKQENRPNI